MMDIAAHSTRIELDKKCQFDSIVGAPSEAWCLLQGASPCWARVNHPPISSVGGM